MPFEPILATVAAGKLFVVAGSCWDEVAAEKWASAAEAHDTHGVRERRFSLSKFQTFVPQRRDTKRAQSACGLPRPTTSTSTKRPHRSRSLASVVVTLYTLCLASAVFAETWDASAQYSTTLNPTGQWAYGRTWDLDTSTFDVMTVRWGESGWYLGNFGHGGPSFSGNAQGGGNTGPHMWAKNNTNGYPDLRWTAPAAGNYRIRAKYTGDDPRGVDNLVYVIIRHQVDFAAQVKSGERQEYTRHAVFLNQGDTVDFILVWAHGVNSEYGWTLTEATITSLSCANPNGTGCLERIAPAKGGNTGEVSVQILGNGFAPQARAQLQRAGASDIDASSQSVSADGTAINATFDLAGAALGEWNVVVTNPGASSATLTNGFLIEGGKPSTIQVEVIGRDTLRRDHVERYYVRYTNPGNIDAVGVPLWILGIPRNADVKLLTEVKNPPIDGFDTDAIPTIIDTGTQQAIPLIIPWLGAGEQGVVGMELSLAPDTPEFDLQAVALPPLFGSGQSFAAARRFAALASALSSDEQLAKYAHCAAGVLHSLGDFLGDVIEDSIGLGCVLDISELILKAFLKVRDENSHQIWAQAGVYVRIVVGCALDVLLPSKAIKVAYKVIGEIAEYIAKGQGVVESIDTCLDAIGAYDPGGSPSFRRLRIRQVASNDPNDIAGPIGIGKKRFINPDSSLAYLIQFENLKTASAPAQDVVVTDQLNPEVFDLSSVSIGQIFVGGTVIEPAPGERTLHTVVDLRPSNTLLLYVNGGVNRETGEVRWVLHCVDPATGLTPDDPLAGFLPPNVTSPQGEGGLTFSVALKPGAETGKRIGNRARIVFDQNPPIATPKWVNIIDASRPETQVLPLRKRQRSPRVKLQWSGVDTRSGLKDYTIFVSEDRGPYVPWLRDTTATSGTFTGREGHSYDFYSVGRDFAGNVEDAPLASDARTKIHAVR